jgi:hypothetical protein
MDLNVLIKKIVTVSLLFFAAAVSGLLVAFLLKGGG